MAQVAASFRLRDKVEEVRVFEPLDLVVERDQAVGTVHDHAVVKATGLHFDVEFATWLKVREGKIGASPGRSCLAAKP